MAIQQQITREKTIKRPFWKLGRRMGQKQKNEKTRFNRTRQTITREQIEKWNRMTALIFHTMRRHQKCPASLWALPKELCVGFSHLKWDCFGSVRSSSPVTNARLNCRLLLRISLCVYLFPCVCVWLCQCGCA